MRSANAGADRRACRAFMRAEPCSTALTHADGAGDARSVARIVDQLADALFASVSLQSSDSAAFRSAVVGTCGAFLDG